MTLNRDNENQTGPAIALERQGWQLIECAYSADKVSGLQSCLSRLIESRDESVRHRAGAVYAARNVLDLCPEILTEWKAPALEEFVLSVLGPDAGLVRSLYFDKPPEQTWALPWHKDLLIAVADDTLCNGYSRPRPRAGVLHSEPPVQVLQNMVTLRVHLDAMTPENGPLEVLTGSHATGKELVITGFNRVTITSAAGDVFAMRPLLVHCSGRSHADCLDHRRVLHLEFSGLPVLPGGVKWQTFVPVRPLATSI